MSLHTDGTHILDQNNKEVIFNGIDTRGLMGYWVYDTGTTRSPVVKSSDIPVLRGHKLNYARLSFALDMAVWHQPMGTPTHINYAPDFWQYLDAIVDACEQNGMWLTLLYGHSDGCWANIGGFWGDGNAFPKWMYDGSWSYFNKIYPNNVDGRDSAIRDFWNLDDPVAANVRLIYQTFWKDIAYRYRDKPHVIFSLYNEPQNQWGGNTTLWNDQQRGAEMFREFTEQTIDIIRSQDGGSHIIIVNEAYFWYPETNLKIRRPNVVIENHHYYNGSDAVTKTEEYAQLAWRYDQPFILGEFGGVEQYLQDRSSFLATMQKANELDISWSYLWYNPYTSSGGIAPSPQTWTDIENNLRPNLRYYEQYPLADLVSYMFPDIAIKDIPVDWNAVVKNIGDVSGELAFNLIHISGPDPVVVSHEGHDYILLSGRQLHLSSTINPSEYFNVSGKIKYITAGKYLIRLEACHKDLDGIWIVDKFVEIDG